MDFDEYRKRGKEMVDYIADYLENIRDRRVFPNVKPGYMRNMLPDHAPLEGEAWEKIFGDVERVIMPGVTHWQSPHMHAYFPALNSFPSLLGDMLADAINCLGFTWASSPACTELETIVMNWLGKMIGLPDHFLHTSSASNGGGVIQTTASESTLVCLLAGRTQAIKKFHEKSPGYQDSEINARLVAYCSDQAHSSVEKAALIGLVRMRYIESDMNLSLRGDPLREAIEDDIKQGLIPFWVCATLGTTGACAFDNLEEVGQVCRDYNLWLHVDAAYAGSAFICPEYRIWLKGIERADSVAFNPSKWLMVHFDCTAMWVKDSTAVHRTFNVEPLYLQHENSGLAIDYMHWQIPLSKRFRSLKLWFVLRSFGIKGLQNHIREGVRLAQKFEALVLADYRFEIPAARHLGMVVFRIKGDNELTERLLKRLNHRGNLHCVPASLKGKYVIRFTVTSTRTNTDDIVSDWAEIRLVTTEILEELNIKIADRAKVPLKETREKNETFGSSLLLANSPMSPKVVNGSFAAIFDADEFLAKAYAGIRISHQDSPSMRRRVRGILMSGKQFSLDSRMDLVVHSCMDTQNTNKINNKTNQNSAIREDSEDHWEVCESPGTPPLTPPPLISPLRMPPRLFAVDEVLENSDNQQMLNENGPIRRKRLDSRRMRSLEAVSRKVALTNQILGQMDSSSDDETVRAQTSCAANTITISKRMHTPITNTVASTVFVHKSEPILAISRCCDAQILHRCCDSSMLLSGNNYQKLNGNNLIFRQQQNEEKGHQMLVTFNSNNNRDKQFQSKHQQSDAEIYHGKRFLDSLKNDSSFCLSLTNKDIKMVPNARARRLFFQESISRLGTSCGGTMPEIRERINETDDDVLPSSSVTVRRTQSLINPPKFRLRVRDEFGKRIRTSFDSSEWETTSGDDLTSPENHSANGAFFWTSLQSDGDTERQLLELSDSGDLDDLIDSNGYDAWTIEPMTHIKCCEKCGHHLHENTTKKQSS